MVSHANLLHNEELIRRVFDPSADSVVVGWLPLHHDMGLIGNVLQPLYTGARCVLMSPLDFLRRPLTWLEAISRHRATTSGGPNFAYEHCLRRIGDDELEGLDLSSWRVAFNGAEPVRAATLERFASRFARYGFRLEAFLPCYGLAEATLFVAGGAVGSPPRIASFDAGALSRHRARAVEPGGPAGPGTRELVSSGRVESGQEIAIVDPEDGRRTAAGEVGGVLNDLLNVPYHHVIVSVPWQLTWYVHIGACLLDAGPTIRYIGRYTKRAVLAEYRITYYDEKVVRFRFKDYAQGGKSSVKTLPVLAFIRRLICHSPDKHFKMIRYAGLFAPRWKARYLEQARQALGQPSPSPAPASFSRSLLPWRERQIETLGKDPLLCRICGRAMKLAGKIFGNHQAIAEYFEAAGIPTKPYPLAWQPDPG